MSAMRLPSATAIERWPWPIRAFLGCGAACTAVALTYSIAPLRAFPLLLAFPTVILSAWFLGMMGGVCCAVTDVILVDQFLTRSQVRFSIGDAREAGRMAMFLLVSILLGSGGSAPCRAAVPTEFDGIARPLVPGKCGAQDC